MKYPLLLIKWEDSVLGSQGWKHINDQEYKVTLFTSVGFLVYEDKDCKVLYSNIGHIDADDPVGSCNITIPKSAIRKIKVLKK